VALGTGEIAGDLSLLAPANASGNGGALAETAAQLNTLASSLASQVNAVSESGVTSSGATGQDFFALQAGVPAALGLSVVPTSVSGVAVAAPGAGAADGSIADQISQIGASAGSPDSGWASFVVSLGTQSQSAAQQATLDTSSQAAASTAQASQESVSLDQESMNLIAYQHAYEGAARVMTTLDSMLDQLINHTGIVGLA
jgi:flagellar hook-associated protein 1 FlgK